MIVPAWVYWFQVSRMPLHGRGSIKLSGLQTQVKSMFELTRLHRVFDIFQTVDDALESY